MNPVAAIFDVDQTLVQGHTERLFFRYLVRQGLLSLPQALNYLGHLAWNPQERFLDKSYLEGLEVEQVMRLARQCYQEEISPRVSLQGLACVLEHQARGHAIALLTGSLAFLLMPLKEELGADWLIATEAARQNGKFTGEIAGLHPRGINKLLLLRDLSRVHGLDLSQSYAYGDHIQDLHIFRHIGHPVAVNPSWRLKRLARRQRWPIRFF
jgi:putative phosphoserine phosphatase/1-acylglycerol-3-phosphate O-acyltransferase